MAPVASRMSREYQDIEPWYLRDMRRTVQRIFGLLEGSEAMFRHNEDVKLYLWFLKVLRNRLAVLLLSNHLQRSPQRKKKGGCSGTSDRHGQWKASFLPLSYMILHTCCIHRITVLGAQIQLHKWVRLLGYQNQYPTFHDGWRRAPFR